MMNRKALDSVDAVSISGSFYRYIRTRFADKPLSMYGSLKNGGRYNVASEFGALYLGFDTITCESEVMQGILAGLPVKPLAFTVWKYDVSLAQIVRLDSFDNLKKLEITEFDITIPGNHWTSSQIGKPLYERKLEGLVAPSAQLKGGKCLDVFLNNLKSTSEVKPIDKIAKWPRKI